jgi:hypothetical protein
VDAEGVTFLWVNSYPQKREPGVLLVTDSADCLTEGGLLKLLAVLSKL